jgi:dolichyl-phosphate beta-glucosyltransferase
MISFILPVHNEEARLGVCLARLVYYCREMRWQSEILCVLNGCVDASAEIAEKFARTWKQIKILDIPTAGKGLAVRTGMLLAKGDLLYMADVDLATPLTELPRYLAAIRAGADLVTGLRSGGDSSIRRAAHAGFAAISKQLTGLSDTQCGFKMFTRACARDVFSLARLDGYAFDVEILMLARRRGWKVTGIPVEWVNDTVHSKVSPVRDGLDMAEDVFHLLLQRP